MMYEEEFPLRLARLRSEKGVSARDMSLSIGQNPGYIQNIECGKALPSMSVFFHICEYLELNPEEFFQDDTGYPENIRRVLKNLMKMNRQEVAAIETITATMVKKK